MPPLPESASMAAPAPSTALEQPSDHPAARAEIVPDDDPYADDPAFLTDSDKASSTQSLSSSVLSFQCVGSSSTRPYSFPNVSQV